MTDVAVVRLPDETRQLEELRRRGVPRLALVAPHAPPFTPVDLLEDWVRLPAAPADVRARVLTLVGRAVQDLHRRPELSDDRLLRYGGGGWPSLPPMPASSPRWWIGSAPSWAVAIWRRLAGPTAYPAATRWTSSWDDSADA